MASKTPPSQSYNPVVQITVPLTREQVLTAASNMDGWNTICYPLDLTVGIDGKGVIEQQIEVDLSINLRELIDPELEVEVNISMVDFYKAFTKMAPSSTSVAELFVRAALAVAMSDVRQDWYSRGATDFMGGEKNAE